MKTCFVTGGTGVVGSAVVARLLAEPATQVQLLVRAQDEHALQQRMRGLYRDWGIDNDPQQQARIHPVRGDAAADRLGLNHADYDTVNARATHIIHCAGAVRMNLPLHAARHTAVGSAHHILQLARQLHDRRQLRKVEFVSTVGVGGRYRGILPERWITKPPAFHNTYEQSKSEAETLVRQAIDEDHLPITVHRPSMVIGDTESGQVRQFQVFYYLCDFLAGQRTWGVYPQLGNAQIDLIPVNYVADAIVAATNTEATRGRIFHLCSGPQQAMSVQALKAIVRVMYAHFGCSARANITLPASMYRGLAQVARWLAPAQQRRALATLPVFLDYLATAQGFSNEGYVQWLASRQQSLPTAHAYLPTVLNHYLLHRHGTSPAANQPPRAKPL